MSIVPLSEVAPANRQSDALYLLSERLHVASTAEEIHEAAMEAIGTALGCDRSAILICDDTGVMRFVASRGLSEEYRAAVTGHSPWRAGDTDAAPIEVPDVASSDLCPELKSVVLGERIRALTFMPLTSDGVLFGKFMAYFREPHRFTPDDLAVGLTIARQLAFAIQRLRTAERLRAREAEIAGELHAMQLLQELSIEMAHEVDLKELYDKLVAGARAILRSDCASMQQYFPHLGAKGELKLIAHSNLAESAQKFWSWVRAETASSCAMAMVSRERVVVSDFRALPRMQGTRDLEEFLKGGIVAAQSTPLLTRRGELVGMISTHWTQPHEPTERDLRLMDILARLAADIIERKVHDEEARRREERLRTLTQLLIDVPWMARGDGAFAELQPAWENYTGQTWDAHAGHGWFDAIHPDDRDGVQASWSAACFNAEPYTHLARVWHAASQQFRSCVIRATPIRNEDGSVREWVGACTEAPVTH